MTIDERLEKLTARHEALAQALELMQHMQQESEARWEKRWTKIEATVQRLAGAAEQDGENIRGLARIAEIHEHRLSRLEGEPSG